MAKILTFRNKGGAPSGQDFLTDENQTLSFRMDEDGQISLGQISQTGFSTLFPDPRKDWSNQELADLFRVRQLLSSANVPVETDRGVTDEGDPWFVFCHANGEVFIHLCRIDGLYVLDSPNVLRPLRGADFDALIADFTNQAIPTRSLEEETERRVIRLDRGGKVRLHPSAMLAALIWTLFLASEELVLLAPEPSEAGDDALLDFDGLFAIERADTAFSDLHLETEAADLAQVIRDGAQDVPQDAIEHGQVRDAHLQQGLTLPNNAFSMGLSTIAIAMGFMSETVLLNNQRKVLEGLKELGFSEYGRDAQQTAELDIPANADGSALLEMLAEFLGLDLSLNTERADAANARQSTTGPDQDLAYLTDDMVSQNALLTIRTNAQISPRNSDDSADQDHAAARSASAPEIAALFSTADMSDARMTDSAQNTILQGLMDALQNRPELAEIKVGNLTFKTNASLSDAETFALYTWIDRSVPTSAPTSYRDFDSVALRLIEFLEAKDGDILFLEGRNNSVIMIDITARTGGETATLHWEADDGRTISFVGLAADFQQFDMIA